jgi:hypothetical protein
MLAIIAYLELIIQTVLYYVVAVTQQRHPFLQWVQPDIEMDQDHRVAETIYLRLL